MSTGPHKEDWEKWANKWQERFERGNRDRERLAQTLQSRWREWAGDLLDEILSSRASAVQALTHHEAGVRRCAVSVLLQYWNVRPGDDGIDGIYQLAATESDEETQVIAIRALGACYDNTDDIAVGRALATIVHDRRQPPLARTFAYHVLFQVRGMRLPWLTGSQMASGEKPRLPRAPEDVDWSFVESFLVDDRVPKPRNWFEQVFPKDERELAVCYAEGDNAYHFGKYDEAVLHFSEAIRHNPTFVQTYYMRAQALVRLKRFDEAIEDLTVVLKTFPEWAQAYEVRGDAYEAKGMLKKARADRKAAAEIQGKR